MNLQRLAERHCTDPSNAVQQLFIGRSEDLVLVEHRDKVVGFVQHVLVRSNDAFCLSVRLISMPISILRFGTVSFSYPGLRTSDSSRRFHKCFLNFRPRLGLPKAQPKLKTPLTTTTVTTEKRGTGLLKRKNRRLQCSLSQQLTVSVNLVKSFDR